MRILITGHKGAIGSKLLARLMAYIDDPLRMGAEYELVGLDTQEGENIITCELPKNIDVVYHLAAHSSVENSWKDPVRDMENILSTVRLCHHYPDAKIIYASSAATIDPKSPYGFSKKCAADYLKIFHKHAVILVFPNIFGTGRSVVDYFKGKEEVIVYGDGLQLRDYVHKDDIVAGLDKAFFWEPGEYFLGTGKGTSVLDLAQGKKIIFQEARKEARESILKNTTPNWEPKINVFEYLKS